MTPKKASESIVVQALERARVFLDRYWHEQNIRLLDKAIRLATLERQGMELLREIRQDDSNRPAFGIRTHADELIAAYDKESR